MKEEIIEKDGKKYKVIEVLEDDKKVIVNNWDVTGYEKWYDEQYCMKAVEQNGYALQYVKNQTAEICMKAVEQDGDALQYVDKRVFVKN